MTARFRPSRPVRFAAVTAAALGLGVPAALALTTAPERPRLDDAVVRPASVSDDSPDAPEVEVEHGVEVEHEDDATTTTLAGTDDDDAAVTPAPAPAVVDDDDDAAEDVSGPCDEAEHANDPRCTGVTTPTTVDDDAVEVEDHSGPGRGSDDGAGDDDHSGSHHGDDDRSGSDSGRD